MDALAATPRSRLAAPRRLLRLRSDAALAERFAEGDEAAFAVLFERHRASVVAVCIGVLSSRHDAEDAAQETFAALAVALRSSPPRELRAWLARVARNAAIDLARRRRTRETVNDELSDLSGPDGVISSHVVKDELESVIAGIRELPESQRTALLMRELAGHSYRDIADLLETDEDAVRGLIARARIGLRQYREAAELPCATARAAIAAEPDGRRHDRTVRRHVRGCASCRAYRSALRDDARALRGLLPIQAGGAAGGSAVVGLAAKGALLGTAATQVTAACAVSACAVGGIALLAPALTPHRHPAPSAVVHRAAVRRAGPAVHDPKAGTGPSASTHTSSADTGTTVHHSTSVLTITSGGGAHTRARSGRTSATGSTAQHSAPARGGFTVPSGGHPNGASQPSNAPGHGSAGSPRSGPSPGSNPSNGTPGGAGGSPPGGVSGPGSGSGSGSGGTQQGSSQSPASPSSGAGTGDDGHASWPVFSGRLGDGDWSGSGDSGDSGDSNSSGHGDDGEGSGGPGGASGTDDSSDTQGSDDGTSGSGSGSGSGSSNSGSASGSSNSGSGSSGSGSGSSGSGSGSSGSGSGSSGSGSPTDG